MARTLHVIEQRAAAQHYPEGRLARDTQATVLWGRLVNGEMEGTALMARVLARLDEVEKNGLPPDDDPNYVDLRGPEFAQAQAEARLEAEAERIREFRAQQDSRLTAEAARREEIRLKAIADQVARKQAGLELAALRNGLGLKQSEAAFLTRLPQDMLSRLETGIPCGDHWRRVAEVKAAYEALAKVATPAKPVKS
jgi:hypothetical protein